MNDFLSKLLKLNQEEVLPSPLVNPNPIIEEDKELPEIKSDLKPEPKMPKMQLPKLDLNQMVEKEIQESQLPSDEELLNNRLNELSQEQPQIPAQNKYQELLQNYSKLKSPTDLARLQSEGTRDANLFGAGAKIAQGLAMQSGAKIDDAQDLVKNLRDQSQQLPKDVKESIELEDTAQMNDPASDISKLYRQQAYAMLEKLPNGKQYVGQLENMSAQQLKNLPGMKSMVSPNVSPWIATDRVDAEGNPIRFNKMTGEYSTADGRILKSGDYTARDILRRDALTGQYGIGTAKGMKVLPTQYAGGVPTKKDEQPKEVSYAQIAKAAPEIAKKFDKMQDSFNKDMKDSREVATSVTNLASKLKPGKNNEVDSGLLGGIQTQAAKMAGQKGVLTDQDLVKFAGAGGVAAKLERLADNLQGDMSESDIKFFKRFAQLMGKSLNEDILNRSQLYVQQAKQVADVVAPGITDQNVSKLLGVDKVAPIVQNKKKVIKKGYNPKTNKTQFIYEDGSSEIKDGKL